METQNSKWATFRAIRHDLDLLARHAPTFGEAFGPLRSADGQRVVRYEVRHRGVLHIAHVVSCGIVKRSKVEGGDWLDYVQTAAGYAADVAGLYCCERCDAVSDWPIDYCRECGLNGEF